MHLNAFSFYGGFTDTILYDNMKQVVIDRKIKASEPRFNPKFMDFAEYYGIVIRLCYPYRPETKGKIENTIINGRTGDREMDIIKEILEPGMAGTKISEFRETGTMNSRRPCLNHISATTK